MQFQKILLFIIIFVLIIFISIMLLSHFNIGNYIYFYLTSEPWTMTATIEKISEYNGITSILVRDSNSSLYDFSVERITKLIHNSEKISITDLMVGQEIRITAKGMITETIPASIDFVEKIEVLDKESYELEERYRVEYDGIADINDFYIHSITSTYKDIRTLPENYSKEQAQKDNCFAVGAMVHNDNLYSEFMNKYSRKENTFIRVVNSTAEGDIIIIDVLYEARNNKIHLVKDYSRDKFSSLEDRTIKYNTYEKTGIWNYQNSQYWVAYNGHLPDGTNALYSINSDELFIIATIN